MERNALALTAVLALALLAGCSAAGSLDMRAVDDAGLAEAASRSLPASADDDAAVERRSLVRSAVTNGSAVANGTSPPIETGLPFAVDGAYYDLNWSVVDRRQATQVTVEIDYNASVPDGTAIAYDDLPAPDRALLSSVIPRTVPVDQPGPEVGASEVYSDADLNASVLAPTQTYAAVTYDGNRYAIDVTADESVEVETYRYEATRVADSAEAYGAHLRDRYAFALANLSDAERSVVRSALGNETYYAESDSDDTFASVLERFRAHEAITEDEYHGTWVVEYDGTVYVAELYYEGFDS